MQRPNPQARLAPYPAELRRILNIAAGRESRAWLSSWSLLSPGSTPAWSLAGLAEKLDIASLTVKDESKRSTLGSFKVLGAPVALVRLVKRLWPEKSWSAPDLFAGRYATELREFTTISATDGNHGRALAAAAHSLGCSCVIVLHAHVSQEREDAIAAFGARIVRIAGDYDDSVVEAARLARENGWEVVSDTSYDGYEDIPRDVMQGYGVLVDELLEDCADASHCPWSHVVLQGGVGGLAAGVVSHFHERYGAARPFFIVFEPEQADCLYQSAVLGRAARATGSVDSVMAGLACGETSPLAWRFLNTTIDLFMTVTDAQAESAMRTLADAVDGDVPVESGESGAAGLAALLVIATNAELRRMAQIDSGSRVLLFSTEGATAPSVYQRIVGRPASDVLAKQDQWLRARA